MLTEDLPIGNTIYTLKTALGWYEMQQIEQAGVRMFADGKAVKESDDIADIPLLELRLDTAEATLRRLSTWLVDSGGRDYKPIEAKQINPAHVPVLLARIEELEAAQAAEVKALADSHPLMVKRAAQAAAEKARQTPTQVFEKSLSE